MQIDVRGKLREIRGTIHREGQQDSNHRRKVVMQISVSYPGNAEPQNVRVHRLRSYAVGAQQWRVHVNVQHGSQIIVVHTIFEFKSRQLLTSQQRSGQTAPPPAAEG
jgi:hypothetical protein